MNKNLVRNYASSSSDSEVVDKTEQRQLAKSLVSYIEKNCDGHKYFRAIQNMQEELKNVVQEVEGKEECQDFSKANYRKKYPKMESLLD